MMAVHRLQDHGTGNAPPAFSDKDKDKLAKDLEQYKDEAEKEDVKEVLA
jgi:hypothetical protein